MRSRITPSCFLFPALLLVAAALRLYQLGATSFWYDEAYSLAEAENLNGIVTGRLIGSDAPLFPWLLHFWGLLFHGEFQLRLLSALFGVLTVGALYHAARHLFGNRCALVAGVMAAVSPFLIYYSQELRTYSLFAFLTVGAMITLYRAARGDGVRWWVGYSLLAALGLYSHHFGFFTLAAGGVYLLFFSGVIRHQWRPFLIACVGAGLLYAPWVPIMAKRFGDVGAHFVGMKFAPQWIPLYLKTFAVGHHDIAKPLWVGATLGFCALVALGLYAIRTHRREVGLLVCYAGVPFALALIFTVLGYRVFIHRYLICSAVPLVLLAAVGLTHSRWRVTVAPAALLGVGTVASLCVLYANGPMQELIIFPKKPYRALMETIVAHRYYRATAVVVHLDNCSYLPFYHYSDGNTTVRNLRLRKRNEPEADLLPLYKKTGMVPVALDDAIKEATTVWLVLSGWSDDPASEASLPSDRADTLRQFRTDPRLTELPVSPLASRDRFPLTELYRFRVRHDD